MDTTKSIYSKLFRSIRYIEFSFEHVEIKIKSFLHSVTFVTQNIGK